MEMTATINLSHGVTVETLIKSLQAVPKNATVKVGTTSPDTPVWERPTHYLQLTWSA